MSSLVLRSKWKRQLATTAVAFMDLAVLRNPGVNVKFASQ